MTNRNGDSSSACICCGNAMRRTDCWTSRCTGCGFMTADLAAGSGRGVAGLDPVRLANDRQTLDEVRRLLGEGRKSLLDVGSGAGQFLDEACRRGFDAEGVEPTPAAASGPTVHVGRFPATPGENCGNRYDAITFNHSFEHLPDPVGAAAAAQGLLKADGVVALQLPSSSGFLFRCARALSRMGVAAPWEMLWQKGLPSPHLSYFNPTNLTTLLSRETGVRLVARRRLQAVRLAGLYRRIRCRFPMPTAFGLFVPTAIAMPLLRFVAPDFVLLVYRAHRAQTRQAPAAADA